MSSQIETLSLAIPRDEKWWRGSMDLLRTAGIPSKGEFQNEVIYFDKNTNGLRRPTEGQATSAVNIELMDPSQIAPQVAVELIDLAIITPESLRQNTSRVFREGSLKLPTEVRDQTMNAELISSEMVWLLTMSGQLRGIRDFRSRLVIKLLKASIVEADKAKSLAGIQKNGTEGHGVYN
jgi:hypothetical protein